MSAIDDYTIDDARHYGFGLLGLYKLWHWNNCIPHGPWHDELDEKMRATQRELDDRYQLLPMDADSEVIHVGDELCGYGYPHGGVYCKAIANECTILVGVDDEPYGDWLMWDAGDCHHYHKPTIEDILRRFGFMYGTANADELDSLVAEYAERLQLKEDE